MGLEVTAAESGPALPEDRASELEENEDPNSLLGEPAAGTGLAKPDPHPRPIFDVKEKAVPLNSLRHRLTRLIVILIGILGAGLIIAIYFAPDAETRDAVKEIGTLIFPALVTLAGTSFAWFFASKEADRTRD